MKIFGFSFSFFRKTAKEMKIKYSSVTVSHPAFGNESKVTEIPVSSLPFASLKSQYRLEKLAEFSPEEGKKVHDKSIYITYKCYDAEKIIDVTTKNASEIEGEFGALASSLVSLLGGLDS